MDQEDGRCPGTRGAQGEGGCSFPRARPRPPLARSPEAPRWRCARVLVGVPGSARGSSAGLGSHTGQPSPAALHARAGNFLTGSCHLAGKGAPLQSAQWASPQCPLTSVSLPPRWVSACSQFCTVGESLPQRMPRKPWGGGAVQPAPSWGPSGLELHSCGMGDMASHLTGLGRTLTDQLPQPRVLGGALPVRACGWAVYPR